MALRSSKHVLFAEADPETVNHEAYCAFRGFEHSSPELQWSFEHLSERYWDLSPHAQGKSGSSRHYSEKPVKWAPCLPQMRSWSLPTERC